MCHCASAVWLEIARHRNIHYQHYHFPVQKTDKSTDLAVLPVVRAFAKVTSSLLVVLATGTGVSVVVLSLIALLLILVPRGGAVEDGDLLGQPPSRVSVDRIMEH